MDDSTQTSPLFTLRRLARARLALERARNADLVNR